MLRKIIDAWTDSYRVIESRRVVRRTAERLVWSGSSGNEPRLGGNQLLVRSWI